VLERREFIALLGGAGLLLAAKVRRARAQQQPMPVIGFLSIRSPADSAKLLATFREGLKELGFVEGQNITIEYRWADSQYDRLSHLTSELIDQQPAVLVAFANPPALVAKATTAKIPIVFGIGGDPVQLGLVASLNRPGGNVTGVSFFASQLEAKRLGLLQELAPKANVVAVLVNPNNHPAAELQSGEVREAARSLGLQLHVLNASSEGDFDAAFAALTQLRAGALLVAADSFFYSRRDQLVVLAALHAIPAIYEWREFSEAGGLASYGTDLADAYRRVGIYTGRVLKGEKPASLPVMRSTRFEFIINLKTAKALGLEIPPTLLARADEVIE
jgi:putative tryptophan/tyrosine transport system substrate-binding protein